MSSKAKHRQRSSRAHQRNVIPVNMFATHALKVAEARYQREKANIILGETETEEVSE